MTTNPATGSEWRFVLESDLDSESPLWSLAAFKRSGDEWTLEGRVPLPMVETREDEQVLSTPVAPSGTGADAPIRISAVGLGIVSQLAAMGSSVLGEDLDHGHWTINTGHRWTEEADLSNYEIDISLTLCSTWVCGKPDDGGIARWHQSPHSGKLVDRDGQKARSDEELAALAIQKTFTDAKVWKIPESEGSLDVAVDFPERSNANDALVEVTMHTDRKRRELDKANPRRLFKELQRDWDIRFLDSRFIGSYDAVDILSLREISGMMVKALRQIEKDGLDDSDCITEACEQAIVDNWPRHLGFPVGIGAPLKVFEVTSEPAGGSVGSIRISVAPLTFNFRNVVDVSDLKTAIQTGINAKLAKNQWGETEKEKWLVIVLDNTEAATQLLGDAFAFEDHTPDFSDIQFGGIDEVWVVAFNDGTLTTLRFIASSANWKHCPRVPVA